MEQRILTIEARDSRGKNACRRLRKEAKIPAVIYGKGLDSVAVTVNRKELETAIAGEGGINHLITLKGAGDLDGKFVIVADLTRNCLKGNMLHVDLHQVNLLDKVKVKVPVSISAVAKGVKDGGICRGSTEGSPRSSNATSPKWLPWKTSFSPRTSRAR